MVCHDTPAASASAVTERTVFRQEVLAQDLAGMNRTPRERTGVRDAHGVPLQLVIVAELEIEHIAVLEAEADPPLMIDGNGVLSSTSSPHRVQPIAWPDAQITQQGGRLDSLKLAECAVRHVGRHTFRLARADPFIGQPIGEGQNHLRKERVT